jgi:heme oxygenase
MVKGGCVEKSKHNRVIENLWFFVDELVHSTQYCGTQRGIAEMTFRHTISLKKALEVLERNSCCDALFTNQLHWSVTSRAPVS